jgi:hypothetical protein
VRISESRPVFLASMVRTLRPSGPLNRGR